MPQKTPRQPNRPVAVRRVSLPQGLEGQQPAGGRPHVVRNVTASKAADDIQQNAIRAICPTYQFVNLHVERVECVKTTRELFSQDDLVLVGIKSEGKIGQVGGQKRLAGKATAKHVHLGKFKKGEVRTFSPPKLVAQFGLGVQNGEWPRSYSATLLLIEQDEGDIGTIVNTAIDSIEKELTATLASMATGLASTAATTALTAAGAGAAAGSVVPLVGTAVGAAAAAATTLAIGAIKRSRRDDVLEPRNLKCSIGTYPAKDGKLEGSKAKLVFTGDKAKYEAVFSWSIQ